MKHREHRDRYSGGLLVLFVLLATPVAAQAPAELPFERTEDVEPCTDYEPLKQPFFGSTHVHTQRSFDASINLVPATPRQAYQFAKGEIDMPGVDPHGWVSRLYPHPDPPLDWGTVTDHSEYFGAVGICQDHETKPPGYYSLDCQLLRGFYYQPKEGGIHPFQPLKEEPSGTELPPSVQRQLAHSVFSLFGALVLGPGSRNIPLPICNDFDCAGGELGVWEEMQAAAHEAHEHCKFTTFVGYEATSAPGGTTWHRNVIFRNANVIRAPVTAIDMAREPNPDPETVPPDYPGGQDPEKLWNGLQEKCIEMSDVIDPKGAPCDALTIPHNSNLGGGVYVDGRMVTPPAFFDPPNPLYARKRQKWEPLVEIYQTKGSSECRWDPRLQAGVETSDEHCAFELLDASAGSAAGGGASNSLSDYPERSWVRNVLKDGLKFKRDMHVNPFKLGIVSSNDTHNGTMGWHPEDASPGGHAGISDAVPTASSTIQNSYAGHSVVWAEENSRDAIFHALKNKETYGTSGTRIVVRFFGGWEFPDDLDEDNFVEAGYQHGVPMGGDLKEPKVDGPPVFVVAAHWDEYIKTPLQQIQIIKGWVDKRGRKTYEKVFTVAGGDNGAGVDLECNLTGTGHKRLFSVWEDREFDPEVPAFYYVRVLENPVCRYSTHICQERYGINPLATDCANQLEALRLSDDPQDRAAAADGAFCCSNETTTPIVQPVIQERAWTSPIWYTPPSLLSELE